MNVVKKINELFSLSEESDFVGASELIKKNITFKSVNAWTLFFAILIASIGLNVNSTAVIIGAMLISPLMGPIVGAGFSLGVNDFALFKRSLKNLFYAVVISVCTSTIYFYISPLTEAQSELLARTSPTFYDVLIALIGGAAGIVSLSQKEKGNPIPGVAIATALMPPLCTAGYGLANAQWSYFFGAIYLFLINSVFICFATYVFVNYLSFPKVVLNDLLQEKQKNKWMMLVVVMVTIPSLYLAWQLQKQTTFKVRVERFVNEQLLPQNIFVNDMNFNLTWKQQSVEIRVLGTEFDEKFNEQLARSYPFYKLTSEQISWKFVNIEDKKMNDQIINVQNNHKSLQSLELKVSHLQQSMDRLNESSLNVKALEHALKITYSKILRVDAINLKDKNEFKIFWSLPPTKLMQTQTEIFIKKFLNSESVKVENYLLLKN